MNLTLDLWLTAYMSQALGLTGLHWTRICNQLALDFFVVTANFCPRLPFRHDLYVFYDKCHNSFCLHLLWVGTLSISDLEEPVIRYCSEKVGWCVSHCCSPIQWWWSGFPGWGYGSCNALVHPKTWLRMCKWGHGKAESWNKQAWTKGSNEVVLFTWPNLT